MNIIALINQKGGVGKTTTAINLGAGLCQQGKKVLLLDLDPQSHLSLGLGISEDLNNTIYNLLSGNMALKDVLIHKNGLHIVPATLDLAGFDMDFSGKIGRENRLKRALKDVNDYDYVLIDCPPSLGLLTINGLVYCRSVFIVLQTEFLALKGLARLMDTIAEIKAEGLNESIEVKGIICTLYDQRVNLHREVVEKIREHFGPLVFNTIIRNNISLAESQSQGKSIFDYKPTSTGAADYLELTREVINRMEP